MIISLRNFTPAIILIMFLFAACDNKDEEPVFVPPDRELSSDKESELQAKEEFLRLKEEELMKREKMLDTLSAADTTQTQDTVVKKPTLTRKQRENIKKEKELNQRISNPTSAINDYLEYIKRGVSKDGNFEKNMKNASKLWQKRSVDVFKKNYKDTKKFQVISDPKVVKQSGNTATVKVKVKQTDIENSAEKEIEMEVLYNLVADKNGNWKIKSNKVIMK